ncbi:PREDICTED: tRNA wybutosine-synthesizing protein 3 homolog [Dipodomys ordii]|uniref:tRNA wybutosine-synthesizing protein 3 homolog n=1 Tax=Dipodomys ordii TaxID=10020 RepID=A0A1S3F750_DIPOR|nr:PREDICTED: tRNA wybutosine-synthesizing protein 3 homolog [Dipodomys ordii]
MAAPGSRLDSRDGPAGRGLTRASVDPSAEFGRWKAQRLNRADLSRKGSVDEDVVELVRLLNSREQFVTTSSCAGRVLLLDGGVNGFEVQKQNCCWLLVSHKPCVKDDVMVALKKANGDAILKFEPLVLHVQCRQLEDAQILHSVAIDSGFRNSGITVGKRGKTMLAVRSTHGLEVPLSHKGNLMVTEEYIEFLLKIANQKMEENKKRIDRFYNCLQHALEKETITDSHPKVKEKNKSSYTHKKKKPEKTHGQCIPEENDEKVESDNDDEDPKINSTIFPEDY